MYCSRMSIFGVLNTKNHSVESNFFADFESIWLSKKYHIKLSFLGKIIEIQNFKILYALRKGRNIVRSFVKTAKFLHPPQGGGRLIGKYFDKHIRSKYFCYHSKEKVWADVLNTHHLTDEKIFKTIWKKSLKIFEVKICLVAVTILYGYCRVLDEVLTLNVSKKLFMHFPSMFYIFKRFSGTRTI